MKQISVTYVLPAAFYHREKFFDVLIENGFRHSAKGLDSTRIQGINIFCGEEAVGTMNSPYITAEVTSRAGRRLERFLRNYQCED